MSTLPLNKEYRSCCNVCVDVLSRHLPFFLVFFFRFCYFDDQLLLQILITIWVSNTSSILYDLFLKASFNMPLRD